MRGWYDQVRKAKDAAKLARAYEGLSSVTAFCGSVTILPMTETDAETFFRLRKAHPRTGKQDLKIAAIVLGRGEDAILVTRNSRDFSPIEGLAIEDWSAG